MKKNSFDRKAAANILLFYREMVRKNQLQPTIENWSMVCNLYNRVSTLGFLDILSKQSQKRASDMFNECTVVI